MIKYIKKAVSALLASIMCIPVSGIVSIANASEMDNNGDFTVTLSESEGGFMQFTDECLSSSSASQDSYHMVTVGEDGSLQEIENDGTVYAFKKGDNIEIELIPDEGFTVKSFEIRDVNTDRVMAQKDTTDYFQFIMHGKNIIVSAEFSDGSLSSIPFLINCLIS